jgi:hypothetical protein
MENRGMPGAVGSSSSRPEEQKTQKVKVVYACGRKPAENEGGNNQMPIAGGVEKAKAAKSLEAVVRRGKAKNTSEDAVQKAKATKSSDDGVRQAKASKQKGKAVANVNTDITDVSYFLIVLLCFLHSIYCIIVIVA